MPFLKMEAKDQSDDGQISQFKAESSINDDISEINEPLSGNEMSELNSSQSIKRQSSIADSEMV